MSAPINRAFSEQANTDKGHGPKMFAAAQALSDGDKSVLLAALQAPEPNALVTTSDGSPNDIFWALLSNVGWMEEASLDLDIQANATVTLRAYSVTELGKNILPIAVPAMFKP